MATSRMQRLIRLTKGLAASIALTLLLTAAIAAAAVFLRASDALLMALNQLMKLTCILCGCSVAIGRGGERGFFTGMLLAMLYMALGYACYVLLGGSAPIPAEMLGEILIGATIGAIAGAVLSNLPPARRGRSRTA